MSFLPRFVDFVTIDNDVAGIEYINAADDDSPWGGATIQDSLVVGHTKLRDVNSYEVITSDQSNCTQYGIHLPFSSRLTVSNVTLMNFDQKGCTVFGACAHCKPNDGGAVVRLEKIHLVNATNLVTFPFQHSTMLSDTDGSFTGYPGGSVLPVMGILDPDICQTRPEMSLGKIPGIVCKSGRFAKVMWNAVTPSYVKGKVAFFHNRYGRDLVEYRVKAKSFKNGYTGFLPLNSAEPLMLSFDLSDQLTNISYTMAVFDLEDSDYVYLTHQFKNFPDFFTTTRGKHNRTDGVPDPRTNRHGSWTFDTGSRNMTYLISGRGNSDLRPLVKTIDFRVYRCYYDGCRTPTRMPLSDINNMTASRRFWSVSTDWNGTLTGYGGFNGSLPGPGDDVIIRSDWWMVMDMNQSRVIVNRLFVDGVLEFNDSMSHHLTANIIFIRGRLIAGWPTKPMLNTVTISLIGNHDSPDLPIANGPNVGAKSIGVFGSMQLYGRVPNTTWTRLSKTLWKGEREIQLVGQVDWKSGDVVVITTSDYEPRHAEVFTIQSVQENNKDGGSAILLNRSAKYTHTAFNFSLPAPPNGGALKNWEMSAKVALISRNIRIKGLDDPAGSLANQSFGCRMLVGSYSENRALYSGNAQLSGVQFEHCGQLGWNEPHDPR